MKKTRKVALGLSGGVDSAVCALILKKAGYDVTAFYLECWNEPGCRTDEDRKDALGVALSLGIEFQVLDFKRQYREKVVEYFYSEYQKGRTPNPDVVCNREIKFGLFYDHAVSQGFDLVATGHYAKILDFGELESGLNFSSKLLAVPQDKAKDQTYFLTQLSSHQLSKIVFPLSGLTKKSVREVARAEKLSVADKKDSQGICFIGQVDTGELLKQRLGENPGDVVNRAGEVVGRHKGLWFYTIGQRHGFQIAADWKKSLGKQGASLPAYFVIEKNPQKNQLIVGDKSSLVRSQVVLEELNWLVDSKKLLHFFLDTCQLCLRIRHTGDLVEVKKFAFLPNKKAKIDLSKKSTLDKGLSNEEESTKSLSLMLSTNVSGVAAGQIGAIYAYYKDEIICLGSGVIAEG